jgi:hypothetical protein
MGLNIGTDWAGKAESTIFLSIDQKLTIFSTWSQRNRSTPDPFL